MPNTCIVMSTPSALSSAVPKRESISSGAVATRHSHNKCLQHTPHRLQRMQVKAGMLAGMLVGGSPAAQEQLAQQEGACCSLATLR